MHAEENKQLVDLLWKSFIIKIQLSFRENKACNYYILITWKSRSVY